MGKISKIWAREIIDSRAIPTVETAVQLDTGLVSVASVPSGTSTGKYESVEFRDRDEKRFLGQGVLGACANVNEKIAPLLLGSDPVNQFEIDRKMIALDASANKSNLGANAILSVSLAVAKAGAQAAGTSFYNWFYQLANALKAVAEGSPKRVPTPIFNMINGGLHGAGNLDFQEFHIIPATSKPYAEGLRGGVEIYHFLEKALVRRGAIHSVGDEGGYAPNLFTNADALEINVEAVTTSGYQIGQDFFLGLDVAANSFYKDGNYSIRDKSNPLNAQSLISFYEALNKEYRLTLLEDPLEEDDWEGWTEATARLGDKLLLVGDDLLATNPQRVEKAITAKSCNSILVKPNQIGTVTETLEVIKLARSAGWRIIVSHRSGETNDWVIADFAVGVKADFVKFGAPARGERVAKYNRLLSIEAELGAIRSEK
ncbi:MAG: phosphopyruvate hydratase [Candidatus Blackburnbacteria bacterium]|nr:phosphopyruvate hydratase [Candidatus Blackburnbacteria bacterium]